MRFHVRHSTRYEYSVPVALGLHRLRLYPRLPADDIEQYTLKVEPTPTSQQDVMDGFGNRLLDVTFAGTTTHLSLESEACVIVRPPSPVGLSQFCYLPWAPLPGRVAIDGAVVQFATRIAADSGWHVLEFLQRLTQTLHQQIDRNIRIEGNAQAAAMTLSTKRGACRDITVLFLDCCAALGISGRFVSGYQAAAETPDGRRHLHAWSEVQMPSSVWLGFDPTHGLAISDEHLPLCAASTQADTMPVEGTFSFQGETVTSKIDYAINVRTERD